MYSFLFDRKSLLLLVAGLATVGCLLFVAGLLTGVFWGVPPQTGTMSVSPPSAAPAALVPASQPCPPTNETETAEEEPKPEPEEEFEEPVPMLEAETRELPAEERRAELPPPPEPVPLDEARRAITGPEPEVAVLAEAAPNPASPLSAPEPAGIKAAGYSLQIGAFRQPANSARIVRELQSRGYDAYVVEEKGGRSIQTVRIGRYAARAEALRAALDFRQREGKEVIVRPLGQGSVRLTSW